MSVYSSSVLLFACFAIRCGCGQPETPAWPQHDGKRRMLSLNADTFHSAVKKHPLLVVLFYVPPGHPLDPLQNREVSKQNWEQLEMMLEVRPRLRKETLDLIVNELGLFLDDVTVVANAKCSYSSYQYD